jgi:hypothetical protein
MQEREKFNDIKSYLRDLKFSVLFDDTKIFQEIQQLE